MEDVLETYEQPHDPKEPLVCLDEKPITLHADIRPASPVAANLSLVKQAGAGSIRDEVVWSGVEKTRGRLAMPEAWDAVISQAAAQGLEPMLILDYGNPFYDNGDKPISEEALEGFARYSEFVVRHFKGRVRLYEIWNEWDIGIGNTTPGTAETYVKLLKKVYPRIKAIDPSIIVYGGAMTPTGVTRGWLKNMLKADGLKHLDQVSIHTYNYSNSGRERTPEAWAEQMAKTQDLLRKYSGGRDVPLAVTEMGWPTQIDRRGMPPEGEAAYLARLYLLARTLPWMRASGGTTSRTTAGGTLTTSTTSASCART